MKISELTKTYKTKYSTVEALKNVTLDFEKTGLVFIVGVSGSGKSTLLNILAGVENPTNGSVLIGGVDITKLSEKEKALYRSSYVGMVFQDYNLMENLSVSENIVFPLKFNSEGLTKEEIENKVKETIKLVDIENIADSKVTEISAGQKQRVAIARAVVKNSQLVLADEPTGNLDSLNERQVFDSLKLISKDKLVIVITHNYDSALEYADRIIEIEEGVIIKDSKPNSEADTEEKPVFKKTSYKFKNQFVELFRLFKNNLVRLISMLLITLLIPALGVVVASLTFYKVGVGYSKYQRKYNSYYVTVSYEKRGNMNYFPIEKKKSPTESDIDHFEILKHKYPKANFVKQYDVYYKIEGETLPQKEAFRQTIESIISLENQKIDDDNLLYEGRLPERANEILITDFADESFNLVKGRSAVNTIVEIGGIDFRIVGTIKTKRKDDLNISSSDPQEMTAFKESLSYINSFVFNEKSYEHYFKNMHYFYDYLTAKLAIHPFTEVKVGRVMITKDKPEGYILTDDQGIVVSDNLYKKAVDNVSVGFKDGRTAEFAFFSMAPYRIVSLVKKTINTTTDTVYLSESFFTKKKDILKGSRAIIETSDPMYNKILENEAIKNEMFFYAKIVKEKIASFKYVMLEIMIVFAFVFASYFFVMNRLLLIKEKKKIGIKYSFGLSKKDIIMPYLLETLFYILISVISIILFTQVIYPLILKSLVFTSDSEKIAFRFYYIGTESYLGWLGFCYLIIISSIVFLVSQIMRKSPIDIIKDL